MDPGLKRDLHDEQASEAYRQHYAQAIAEQEAEYEREFGPEYRAVHPFKPNTAAAHAYAMRKIHPHNND